MGPHHGGSVIVLLSRSPVMAPYTPFVLGHPRSGTSLLTAILDRHSQIAMVPETHLLRALDGEAGRRDHERLLVEAWDTLHTRLGDLHLSPELILRQFRKHSPTVEGLLTAILELWAARAGKPVAGEKTPAHLPFTGRILDGIPRSRAIIVIRDGRAVVAAMRRTRRHADTSIDRLVDGWITAARMTAEWLALYPTRARLVRFEELVTRSEETLRGLLEWLEAEFEARILEPRPTETYRRWETYAKRDVTQPIMPEKAESWREGEALLSEDQLQRLVPWLSYYGYPPGTRSEEPASQPLRAAPMTRVAVCRRERRLSKPPVLVVGAARAGCSSVVTWICSHPEVVPPASQRPCLVLDWPLVSREFEGRLEGQFPCNGSHTTTACHGASYYFAHPDAPRRVRLVAPEAKVVILLRHPVLRAYSHWLREWRLGTESLAFPEALEAEPDRMANSEADLAANELAIRFNHIHYSYLHQSRYWTHLSRWYHAFPAEQILVLALGEVRQEVQAVWDRLCGHAGVSIGREAPAFPHTESLVWPISRRAVIRSAAGRAVREALGREMQALGRLVNLDLLGKD